MNTRNERTNKSFVEMYTNSTTADKNLQNNNTLKQDSSEEASAGYGITSALGIFAVAAGALIAKKLCNSYNNRSQQNSSHTERLLDERSSDIEEQSRSAA